MPCGPWTTEFRATSATELPSEECGRPLARSHVDLHGSCASLGPDHRTPDAREHFVDHREFLIRQRPAETANIVSDPLLVADSDNHHSVLHSLKDET